MQNSLSPNGPEREPLPLLDTSVVHYDTDTIDIVTACGQKLLELSGGDSYSTDPAAVDCPQCTPLLVDGQLAEPARTEFVHGHRCDYETSGECYCPGPGEQPLRCGHLPEVGCECADFDPITPEVYGEFFPERDEHGDAYRETAPPGAIVAAYDAMKAARTSPDPSADTQPLPAPAAPERRTVGLEVLADDLRQTFDVFDIRGTLVGIVCRVNGRAIDVPEIQKLWEAPYRKPADILAKMLTQARFYADGGIQGQGDAELLMPTPDVLAALAGQPVGSWTATVPSRWGVVQPGWLVLIETMVDQQRDSVWLLVEDRTECPDPDCTVAQGSPWSCAVVTIRGRGIQHLNAFHAVSVRIPADQPAPAVTA